MPKLRESQALLFAFRRGETNALEAVYDEYSEDLFVMLKEGFAIESAGKRYRFEGYREPWHLETAVQEIFSRAFSERARNAFDGTRPYKNYLFTIARNYVVDDFHKKRRQFVPIEDIPEPTADDADKHTGLSVNPERAATSRELQELVAFFIDSLSDFERQIFDYRFAQGHSVELSAQEAHVTEYRIKRTEKKIKKQFYVFMKKRGYFDGFRYGGILVSALTLPLFTMGHG